MEKQKEHEELLKVIHACAEHSWIEHGPGGRDGLDGRYIKHGINTKEELEAYINTTVFDQKTKCFEATNNREAYLGPKNEQGYGALVVLNYAMDDGGHYYGGTCQPTDRPNELLRLARREAEQNGTEPPHIIEGGILALRPELRQELETEKAEPLVESHDITRGLEKEAGGVLYVASEVVGGVAEKLVDFVEGVLDFFVGKPPPREITAEEYVRSAEARREYNAQQREQRESDQALERIAADIRDKKNLSAADVRSLSRQELENIKSLGDPYLLDQVKQREIEEERER